MNKPTVELQALLVVDRWLDAIADGFERLPDVQPWHTKLIGSLDGDFRMWRAAARRGRHSPASLAARERVLDAVHPLVTKGHVTLRNPQT